MQSSGRSPLRQRRERRDPKEPRQAGSRDRSFQVEREERQGPEPAVCLVAAESQEVRAANSEGVTGEFVINSNFLFLLNIRWDLSFQILSPFPGDPHPQGTLPPAPASLSQASAPPWLGGTHSPSWASRHSAQGPRKWPHSDSSCHPGRRIQYDDITTDPAGLYLPLYPTGHERELSYLYMEEGARGGLCRASGGHEGGGHDWAALGLPLTPPGPRAGKAAAPRSDLGSCRQPRPPARWSPPPAPMGAGDRGPAAPPSRPHDSLPRTPRSGIPGELLPPRLGEPRFPCPP